VPHWTTFTPDGRRLVVSRHEEGWTVACGESEFAPRERLDVALIEAILIDNDFVLHSMSFDYAGWAREFADEIQRRERPPDDDRAGEG
jgi:hypothetical protein